MEIFQSFPLCEAEILTQIDSSSNVRVFLQIGRTVLSGATGIYDYLAKANLRSGADVKVLHASSGSPYLSEGIAQARGSDYAEWTADLEHAQRKVGSLMTKSGARLEGREHREGYVWRLFIFEECAYVQPYLFPKDNSTKAPVLKLARSIEENGTMVPNPNSLYNVFREYFDQKWAEYTPRYTNLQELIPQGAPVAVASIVRHHQFFVFVVPQRYSDRRDKEVPFHGIGGKRMPGEELTAALHREVKEEVGVGITIIPSDRTRFLSSGVEIDPIKVTNEPKPYCVYRRSREVDPNFEEEDVLWLIGYEAELKAKNFLKPRSEAAALVYLTGDALRKCIHERVTYQQINDLGDGSRIILREGYIFDLNRRAIPVGLALIAGAAQIPRALQRL